MREIPSDETIEAIGVGRVLQPVFTGTGLSDMVSSGICTSAASSTYTVEITATDTFKHRKAAGAWTEGVTITGAAQALVDGVSVTFGHITGYTIGDLWVIITAVASGFIAYDASGNIILKLDNAQGGSGSFVDTDALLTADSNTVVPSQKAVKAAIEALIVALWVIGELAVGEVNGSNCDFSTSSAYVPGTLRVLLNGVLQRAGDFQEILPSAGTFLVSIAPISDALQTDEIKCTYRI